MTSVQHAIVTVTPIQQNCTLLWDSASQHAVVVDPGGDVPRILDAVQSLALRVQRIWLTHGHFDHAGGAAALREALGVGIDGPNRLDEPLLDTLPQVSRGYGIQGARAVKPDRWLMEGDTVQLGGHRFQVLDTPGHTPGHVSFVCAAARVAVVGDVLFRNSVGRTDIPGGDGARLLASIRDKLMPLPDDVAVLCGHGPSTTIGAERRSNPFVKQAMAE